MVFGYPNFVPQQEPTYYNTFVQPQVQPAPQQMQSTAPTNYYGMQGWDTGKLNQSDYHSEKYDLGRAIQTLLSQGVKVGRGNLDPLVDYMKKTYGDKYNISSFGKDDELKLTGGNIVDLVHGGDDAWQFLDTGMPGQQQQGMSSTQPLFPGPSGGNYGRPQPSYDPMQWRRDNYMRQHQKPVYGPNPTIGGQLESTAPSIPYRPPQPGQMIPNGWGGTKPYDPNFTGIS